MLGMIVDDDDDSWLVDGHDELKGNSPVRKFVYKVELWQDG